MLLAEARRGSMSIGDPCKSHQRWSGAVIIVIQQNLNVLIGQLSATRS